MQESLTASKPQQRLHIEAVHDELHFHCSETRQRHEDGETSDLQCDSNRRKEAQSERRLSMSSHSSIISTVCESSALQRISRSIPWRHAARTDEAECVTHYSTLPQIQKLAANHRDGPVQLHHCHQWMTNGPNRICAPSITILHSATYPADTYVSNLSDSQIRSQSLLCISSRLEVGSWKLDDPCELLLRTILENRSEESTTSLNPRSRALSQGISALGCTRKCDRGKVETGGKRFLGAANVCNAQNSSGTLAALGYWVSSTLVYSWWCGFCSQRASSGSA
jgi:hypothetical protein